MPKLPGIKGYPLRTDLTAPEAPAGAHSWIEEGGSAVLCDPASELFMLAMTIIVGEDAGYERAHERDARFVDFGVAQHLRDSLLMRSTPWSTSPR